jgi:hypothetical protein
MRRLISLVLSLLLLSSVGYADPPQPSQDQIAAGYYQSATPTYATGLRVPLNFDVNGNLKTVVGGTVAANITLVSGGALALGQTTKASSLPVTLASDQGNLNVACISGCSGTTLGQALMAASLPVTMASDQSTINVNCTVGCAGGTFNNNADTVATSATNGQVAAWPYVWNGSSWDRLYGDKTNGLFANIKTSVLPTGAATSTLQSTINTTLGSPMQNSGGSVSALQSGTWTVQPGNTANTTAWKVDGSAVTQPVSGTVTANAGSNLNTSALALESGGNLATLAGGVSASKYQVNLASVAASLHLSTNLDQIGGSTLAFGQATMAASIPVTIASNQGAVPASQSGTWTLAANQSVNLTQLNAAAYLTGNGITGPGSPRETVAQNNASIPNWGQGAVGGAPPAGAVQVAGIGSGVLTAPIVCDQSTPFSFGSTSAQKIVAKVSGKKIYICAISIVVAAATNVALIEGTKVTNECDTSTTGMDGGSTAATGWNFAAGGGLTQGTGVGMIDKTANANFDVCLLASGTGQVSGKLVWTQF